MSESTNSAHKVPNKAIPVGSGGTPASGIQNSNTKPISTGESTESREITHVIQGNESIDYVNPANASVSRKLVVEYYFSYLQMEVCIKHFDDKIVKDEEDEHGQNITEATVIRFGGPNALIELGVLRVAADDFKSAIRKTINAFLRKCDATQQLNEQFKGTEGEEFRDIVNKLGAEIPE